MNIQEILQESSDITKQFEQKWENAEEEFDQSLRQANINGYDGGSDSYYEFKEYRKVFFDVLYAGKYTADTIKRLDGLISRVYGLINDMSEHLQ